MQNKRLFGILVLTCVIFLLQASDKFYFSKFSKPTSQTSDNLDIDKKKSALSFIAQKNCEKIANQFSDPVKISSPLFRDRFSLVFVDTEQSCSLCAEKIFSHLRKKSDSLLSGVDFIDSSFSDGKSSNSAKLLQSINANLCLSSLDRALALFDADGYLRKIVEVKDFSTDSVDQIYAELAFGLQALGKN